MPEKLFDAIRKDHHEVKGIFEKMLHAKKFELREELIEKLQSEIVPHMRAEEKALYTTLREDCSECREDVLESFEEHHAARLILNELQELSPDDERFLAKTMVLKEIVEHHMKEEEGKLFEDIRHAMDEKKGEQVLQQFMQEKERIRKKLQ